MRTIACGLLPFLVLAACGGDDDDGGAVSAAQVQAYAQGQCAFFDRCSPIFVRLNWGNVGACQAQFGAVIQRQTTLAGVSLTQAKLDACNAKLAARDCADTSDIPECDFTGTLGEGAPCAVSAQCASGSCFYETRADQTVPDCGVCKAKVNEGESCAANVCANGLNCSASQVCIRPGGANAACADDLNCEGVLGCADGRCTPPIAKDGVCTASSAPCDSSLYCRPDEGSTTTGHCVEIGTADVGGACGVSDSLVFCAAGSCQLTDEQAGTGTCLANPKEGEACTLDENSPPCGYGLECINNVCAYFDSASCK